MFSIDEMTVPREPWKRIFERNQKRYNTQLMVGVGVFAGTIFVAANTVDLNPTPVFLKTVNIETRMPEKTGEMSLEKTGDCSVKFS